MLLRSEFMNTTFSANFFLQTFIQENLDTATLFYYNGQIEKYTQKVFNISHGDCYEHF